MKKWSVEPKEIRVPKGALVHLHVTTADVQHGFDVKGLDISEPVDPGRSTDITFRADKPGKYEVECGILCGRGHDDMGGRIVVD
jgi:cytochrome c oxidase subunit 2